METNNGSNGLIRVKSGNEWLAEGGRLPVPLRLFEDFWHEGETAILFGDTGQGKSALAVQIAEMIATGAGSNGFETAAMPQRVLYLDLELTTKQFEMRYAAEPVEDGDEVDHYVFSDNFLRAEIDPLAEKPDEYESFAAYLIAEIERTLETTAARILIIDNITFLKRSGESSREALDLMRALRRLRERLSLSILVVAHTAKRATSRPLTINDLQGSRMIANFADSIFALGPSSFGHDVRYLKHIKSRRREIVNDASNVVGVILRKLGGSFLGFEFSSFQTEIAHLKDMDAANNAKYERWRQVGKLMEQGHSQRRIGQMLGLSAASVNRYIHGLGACPMTPCDRGCPNEPQWRYSFTDRIRAARAAIDRETTAAKEKQAMPAVESETDKISPSPAAASVDRAAGVTVGPQPALHIRSAAAIMAADTNGSAETNSDIETDVNGYEHDQYLNDVGLDE